MEFGQLFQVRFGYSRKNDLGDDLRELVHGYRDHIRSTFRKSTQVNDSKNQGSIFGNNKIIDFSNFLIGIVIYDCFIQLRNAPATGNKTRLGLRGCGCTAVIVSGRGHSGGSRNSARRCGRTRSSAPQRSLRIRSRGSIHACRSFSGPRNALRSLVGCVHSGCTRHIFLGRCWADQGKATDSRNNDFLNMLHVHAGLQVMFAI